MTLIGTTRTRIPIRWVRYQVVFKTADLRRQYRLRNSHFGACFSLNSLEKTQNRKIQRVRQRNVHISTNNRGSGIAREGGNGDPVERLQRLPALEIFALFGRKSDRRGVGGRFDVHFRPVFERIRSNSTGMRDWCRERSSGCSL